MAGVRTTYGSPIYADHVPDRSDFMVERLEQRGAVVVAKSNAPEFGAGGNTFNEVFGETRNPWDTSRTCGGSSGGSAAALASGQVWLATGSDLGQRAHPGRLLRRRRGPAQSRSGGRRPLAPAVRDDVGGGADGEDGGRCGADAGRDGRPRPTRPAVAGGAGSSLRRRGSRADAAAAGRRQPPTWA